MGLDMYLKRKVFVGAKYEHREVKGDVNISVRGKKLPINFNRISEIEEDVGYWRKANQIHNWFVTNIQDGKDKCQESYVPKEKLIELRDLCLQVLETKESELLPPTSGFFFGSTAIDEYYFEQLEETVNIINNLNLDQDDEGEYYYEASW